MEALLTIFAVGGLLVCALGLAMGVGVALPRPLGGGGALFGIMLCLWWVAAACASIGLLQRDAAVVVLCLVLWGAGALVVFGAGSLKSVRRARTGRRP